METKLGEQHRVAGDGDDGNDDDDDDEEEATICWREKKKCSRCALCCAECFAVMYPVCGCVARLRIHVQDSLYFTSSISVFLPRRDPSNRKASSRAGASALAHPAIRWGLTVLTTHDTVHRHRDPQTPVSTPETHRSRASSAELIALDGTLPGDDTTTMLTRIELPWSGDHLLLRYELLCHPSSPRPRSLISIVANKSAVLKRSNIRLARPRTSSSPYQPEARPAGASHAILSIWVWSVRYK